MMEWQKGPGGRYHPETEAAGQTWKVNLKGFGVTIWQFKTTEKGKTLEQETEYRAPHQQLVRKKIPSIKKQ